MGNRLGKKVRDRSPDRKSKIAYRNKQNHVTGRERRGKYRSCPDIPENGDAAPYVFGGSERVEPLEKPVDVLIFRSYGDLDTNEVAKESSHPDVKVYRRSISSLHSTASLPRNFGGNGRSRTIERISATGGRLYVNNASRGSTVDSNRAPSESESYVDGRGRTLEQPSVSEVKRKLTQFEDNFRRSLVAKMCKLEVEDQLAFIRIAIDYSGNKARDVTAAKLLQNPSLLLDSHKSITNSALVLTAPHALVHKLLKTHRIYPDKLEVKASVLENIVESVAVEVAFELSRIYEYQIVMLMDNVSSRLLAAHAAECVVQYVENLHQLLDRNTALDAISSYTPSRPEGTFATVSVVIGKEELQWDIYNVFKEPGVRKELSDIDDLIDDEFEPDTLNKLAWRFYIDKNNYTDEGRYGYRGQLLDWDFERRFYRLSSVDERINIERRLNPHNPHQQYVPFRRLASAEDLERYCMICQKDKVIPFNQYLRDARDAPFVTGSLVQKEIQPVFRPISPFDRPLQLEYVNLDNTDMTRAQLRHASIDGATVRRGRFVLADLQGVSMRGCDLDRCDLSYTNMAGVTVDYGALKRTQAKHVFFGTAAPIVVQKARENNNDVDDDCNACTDADGNVVTVTTEVFERAKRHETRQNGDTPEITINARPVLEAKPRRKVKKKDKVQQQHLTSHQQQLEINSHEEALLMPRRSQQHRSQPRYNDVTPQQPHTGSGQTERTKRGGHARQSHTRSAPYFAVPKLGSSLEPSPPTAQQRQVMTLPPQSVITKEQFPSATNVGATPPPLQQHRQSLDVENTDSPRRQNISRESLQNLSRSRVLEITKGLEIMKIEESLPTSEEIPYADVTDDEAQALANRQTVSCRHISIMGAAGSGKSSLAVAVASKLRDSRSDLVAVYFDLRAAITTERLTSRMAWHFGLRFGHSELALFFCWLNSHDQRLLFVLDNVDAAADAQAVSDFVDELLNGVHHLRVITTSCNGFYKGSERLCSHNVTADRISENLLNAVTAEFHLDPAADSDGPEESVRQLVKQLPADTQQLLAKLSQAKAGFDRGLMETLSEQLPRDTLASLERASLLRHNSSRELYEMPTLVRLALEEDAVSNDNYVTHYLTRLKQLTATFHSPESFEAIHAAHRLQDVLHDTLSQAAEAPHLLGHSAQLVTMEAALFLQTVLHSKNYSMFLDSVEQMAAVQSDVLTVQKAKCSRAHLHCEAKQYELALDILKPLLTHSEAISCTITKAFVFLTAGRSRFHVERRKEHALTEARNGLDLIRMTLGSQRPLSLHACEMYATLLVEQGSLQMARHFFNISDAVVRNVLGLHPALLNGYDARRKIWDNLLLYSRSTECAQRAAQIAQLQFRAHPRTASALSRLVDAIIKRGSLSEAVKAAVEALAIRTQVQADHVDTAQAYKKLAYLMLRSGHLGEALGYASTALEIAEKVTADDKQLFDLKNLISQARYRQEYRDNTHYIQMDTRAAKQVHSRSATSTEV